MAPGRFSLLRVWFINATAMVTSVALPWLFALPSFATPTPQANSSQVESPAETKSLEIVVENALLKTIETTHLAAEVSGRIASLNVAEGTKIDAGAAVGKVSDAAIQLKLDNARVAMAIARKTQRSDIDLQLAVKRHEVAKEDLDRAINANKRTPNTYNVKEVDRLKLLAESTKLEIDRAQHQMELAELEVLLAENEFRQAEELLERHQIRSPVSGVVVSLNKRAGEWVEPGTELMQIVSTDRLRIEGFINATLAIGSFENRPVRATVMLGDQQHEMRGRVVFVSPDANPLNNQVRVFLEIDNSEGRLRPGMRVQAVIEAPIAGPASEPAATISTAKPNVATGAGDSDADAAQQP